MALKSVEDNVYESITPAWPPAPFKRAFGGHVYAQAVYAASKTVEPGLVVHVRPASFRSILKHTDCTFHAAASDRIFSPSWSH